MATTIVEMQPKSEPRENLRLEIKRVIKASRQRVFDAWTRPEVVRQWFRTETKTMEEAEINARVDGDYRFAMSGVCEVDAKTEGNEKSVVTGRYVRVEPYNLLSFTWKNCQNPDEESLVTIELRDVDGGTEMKLTHQGFFTEKSRDGHFNGWSRIVSKLVELFEKTNGDE